MMMMMTMKNFALGGAFGFARSAAVSHAVVNWLAVVYPLISENFPFLSSAFLEQRVRRAKV
jgi:hypothetical protein